jgi:RimJ/RimL family protein N-acetyltransferase
MGMQPKLKFSLSFWFKNLKLHRITAGCAIDNIASIKVLEKWE